jgi:hypothetical protein
MSAFELQPLKVAGRPDQPTDDEGSRKEESGDKENKKQD